MYLQGLYMRFPQVSSKTHISAYQIWRQNCFGVLRQVSGMAHAQEICPQSSSKRECWS